MSTETTLEGFIAESANPWTKFAIGAITVTCCAFSIGIFSLYQVEAEPGKQKHTAYASETILSPS